MNVLSIFYKHRRKIKPTSQNSVFREKIKKFVFLIAWFSEITEITGQVDCPKTLCPTEIFIFLLRQDKNERNSITNY